MKFLPYIAVLFFLCFAGCESKPAVEQKTVAEKSTTTIEKPDTAKGKSDAKILLKTGEQKAKPSVPTKGLLAYWNFDGTSKDEAKDAVGNLHGRIYGAKRGQGIRGSALYFDGRSNYVYLGNPPKLNFTGQITMAAWIKPLSFPGKVGNVILVHGIRLNPNASVFLNSNKGHYQIGSWDGVAYMAKSPIPSSDIGKWVHMAGVYDGKTWRLYRNGREVDSQATSKGAIFVNVPWAIGGHHSGKERFFHGGIDEVLIYNRPLSAQEIAALATAENSVSNTAPTNLLSKTATDGIYLDDVKETEFSVGWGTMGKHGDAGYRDKKCILWGVMPSHAISIHPPSQKSSYVTYNLDGSFHKFQAMAVIWEEGGGGPAESPVNFKVFGDGKLLWLSRPIQMPGDGQNCSINIQGVRVLKLQVDCHGKNGRSHAVWVNPKVTKSDQPAENEEQHAEALPQYLTGTKWSWGDTDGIGWIQFHPENQLTTKWGAGTWKVEEKNKVVVEFLLPSRVTSTLTFSKDLRSYQAVRTDGQRSDGILLFN